MSGPSIKLEYDFNYVEWVTQFYFKYDSYILVVVLGSVCLKVLLVVFITVCAKVQYYDGMYDIGVKQGCLLFFPTQIGMHVEELETYLDKIDGNLLVLFNIVVATLNYVDNFIMMSKL